MVNTYQLNRFVVLSLATVALSAPPASAQTIYYSKSGALALYSSTWNGASWDASVTLPPLAANGYWLQASVPKSGSEISLAATDANSTVKIMFNTTGSFGTPTTLTADSGYNTVRKFAIAYEQNSADCMVAYATGTGQKVDYRTRSGGTTAAAATAMSTTATATDCVRLASKPNSDELMLLACDYDQKLSVRIWNGSSWGSTSTLSSAVQSQFEESFAGAYETTSGEGLVVYSNAGSATPFYRTYKAGSWSSQASMAACSSTPQYIHLAANPKSNEVVCGIIDDNKRIRMYIWNGATWTSNSEVSTNAAYNDRRPFDVAYEPDGSAALVVYSDNTTKPAYRTYNGSTWSSATRMDDMGPPGPHNQPAFVQVVPGKSGGEMFVAVSSSFRNDLFAWKWDGSAMGSMATIETSLGGSSTTEQFWLLGPQQSGVKIIKWREVPN